jgi:hypothetical protein
MCMFCAAIPMSVSIGAALAGKQRRAFRDAQTQGKPLSIRRDSYPKTTLAVTGGLLVCSAIYHLVIMPRTGAVI